MSTREKWKDLAPAGAANTRSTVAMVAASSGGRGGRGSTVGYFGGRDGLPCTTAGPGCREALSPGAELAEFGVDADGATVGGLGHRILLHHPPARRKPAPGLHPLLPHRPFEVQLHRGVGSGGDRHLFGPRPLQGHPGRRLTRLSLP